MKKEYKHPDLADYIKFKDENRWNPFRYNYGHTDITAYNCFLNIKTNDEGLNVSYKEDLYNEVHQKIDALISKRLNSMLTKSNKVLRKYGYNKVECELNKWSEVVEVIRVHPRNAGAWNVLEELNPILFACEDHDDALRKDLFHFFGLFNREVFLFNHLVGSDDNGMREKSRQRKAIIAALKRCEEIRIKLNNGKIHGVEVIRRKTVLRLSDADLQILTDSLSLNIKELGRVLGDVELRYTGGVTFENIKNHH